MYSINHSKNLKLAALLYNVAIYAIRGYGCTVFFQHLFNSFPSCGRLVSLWFCPTRLCTADPKQGKASASTPCAKPMQAAQAGAGAKAVDKTGKGVKADVGYITKQRIALRKTVNSIRWEIGMLIFVLFYFVVVFTTFALDDKKERLEAPPAVSPASPCLTHVPSLRTTDCAPHLRGLDYPKLQGRHIECARLRLLRHRCCLPRTVPSRD